MHREQQFQPTGKRGNENTPVRIALVDDDQSIHQAINLVFKELAADWLLDSYLDGHQALHYIRSAPPHAILMDIIMPGISGIECTSKLKMLYPNLPIVMFSARTDTDAVINSMMAGACGYLMKPVSAAKIVVSIKKALRGSMVLCQPAERAMLNGLHSFGQNTTSTPLSHREKEIMTGVCRWQSDKEIAETLGISAATVHAHLARIFKKLEAHNRVEAMKKFLYLGEE